MKCGLCGGKLQRKIAKIELNNREDRIIIKVEADVCEGCGEPFYSDEVANKIGQIKEKMDEYRDKRLPKIREISDKIHLQRIGEVYESVGVIRPEFK